MRLMGNASFQERLQHAVESSQYEHVTQRKDPLLAARREGRSLATKDFRSKGRRPDPPVPAEPVTMYEWPVVSLWNRIKHIFYIDCATSYQE